RRAPGGPAEQAGLRGPRITRERTGPLVFEKIDRSAADVIIGVDNQPVKTADAFLGDIEQRRPGDTVAVTIRRGEAILQIPLTLGDPRGE
ncbi:MAG: PDZ domain-containing protein, partial [Planctomycetota bacterium]